MILVSTHHRHTPNTYYKKYPGVSEVCISPSFVICKNLGHVHTWVVRWAPSSLIPIYGSAAAGTRLGTIQVPHDCSLGSYARSLTCPITAKYLSGSISNVSRDIPSPIISFKWTLKIESRKVMLKKTRKDAFPCDLWHLAFCHAGGHFLCTRPAIMTLTVFRGLLVLFQKISYRSVLPLLRLGAVQYNSLTKILGRLYVPRPYNF